ncbi:MAG: outer membrane beta-barrel protein [Chlorobia bacterium]|nr:outer membrane beta-barrel protein [Fimbriimonadaceae bacterium]
MIVGLFAAALVASPAFADVGAPAPTAKDLEKVVEKVNFVETAKEGIKLSGYVDAGYIYNFIGGGSVINGRIVNDANSKGDFNLNAVKLTLEKPLTKANEFQAGFRADLKVGEDANNLNNGVTGSGAAFNGIGGANVGAINPNSGSSDTLSLEQAYVIVRAPIGNGLDITMGKFASLLGYEVDDRPANLNITFGYDYVFQTSHNTGIKFYYPVNDIVELQLAVTNGSGLDSSTTSAGGQGLGGVFANGLTDVSDSDSIGAYATINIKAPGGNANWFNGIYVAEGTADGIAESGRDLLWNSWGNWAPKFANDKLLLGFSNTIGIVDDNAAGTGAGSFWNPNLYAKYQFTDIFSLAGRASYLHTVDGFGAPSAIAVPSAVNGDAYSWTLTAGFDLLENLLLRAEYRVDFYDQGTNGVANDESGDVANTLAFQAVYTF